MSDLKKKSVEEEIREELKTSRREFTQETLEKCLNCLMRNLRRYPI